MCGLTFPRPWKLMSSLRTAAPNSALEPPIRDELLSAERLEQHAEGLAAQRTSASARKGPALSPRLRDNGRILLQCYRTIAEVIRNEGTITPAAEWFVDNFHIIDEVLRDVRNDLPEGFYRQLPKLAEGPFAGYPRVFSLAWAFVAHTDSRFDPTTLRRFVSAFQRVQPLTIGELWAVPIALRMVLLENLRRLAEHIVTDRAARQEADALANELLGVDGHTADPTAFRRLEGQALPTTFAVQVVQRLRDQDPELTPALEWLNERLSVEETSADEIVRSEHQSQGAMNVTVRNVITSMRMMSTFDWAEFFERVSLVDQALRAGSDFEAMDFVTRDRYRHAIEDLSRGSGRSELDVAREAVSRAAGFAREAQRSGTPPGDRREEPGYYLISKGRPLFEKALGYRLSLGQRLIRSYVSTATPSYLGTIAILTALFLALPLVHAHESMRLGWLGLLGLLALIPASDLAIALVNRTVMELIGPRRLPRLALRGRAAWSADRGGRADPAHERSRHRRATEPPGGPLSRQPGRRPALPSSRTGPTPPRRRCRTMTGSWRRRSRGSDVSTNTTHWRAMRASGSSCCIEGGSGTRESASGWAGSASGASSTS
jgi:cyclic beta-1,2-glucan synthetase